MNQRAVIFDCFGVLYTGAPLVRQAELFAYAAQLRARGFKVAVLSNCSVRTLMQLFDGADRRLFDELACSEAIGVAKPQPAAYEYVCERLLIEPSAAVMVDDSADNCQAAQALGMAAVQHRTAEATIAKIEELLHA